MGRKKKKYIEVFGSFTEPFNYRQLLSHKDWWLFAYLMLQSREQRLKVRSTTSRLSRESAHGMIHVCQGQWKKHFGSICY